MPISAIDAAKYLSECGFPGLGYPDGADEIDRALLNQLAQSHASEVVRHHGRAVQHRADAEYHTIEARNIEADMYRIVERIWSDDPHKVGSDFLDLNLDAQHKCLHRVRGAASSDTTSGKSVPTDEIVAPTDGRSYTVTITMDTHDGDIKTYSHTCRVDYDPLTITDHSSGDVTNSYVKNHTVTRNDADAIDVIKFRDTVLYWLEEGYTLTGITDNSLVFELRTM